MLLYLLSSDELREVLNRLDYHFPSDPDPEDGQLLPGPAHHTGRRSVPL